MTDPEGLVRSLPDETPPQEIVLAAVRVFRYRAMAVVALAAALGFGSWLYFEHLAVQTRLLERIPRIQHTSGGTTTVADERVIDGVHVLFWEAVEDWETIEEPGSVYVHVIAWGPEDSFTSLDITDPSLDGRALSIHDHDGGGGAPPPTYDLWSQFEMPEQFEIPDGASGLLTFDVLLFTGLEGDALLDIVHFQFAL